MTEAYEDKKIKGEVTIVLAPADKNHQQEMEADLKKSGFDLTKDAIVSVNIVQMAKALDSSVDMGYGEFRDLLKQMFP